MITATVSLPNPVQVTVILPLLAVGGECAPATYRNNDGSYIQEIESGGQHIAPPIEIRAPKTGNNDIDGQAVADYLVNIPANTDHLLPESAAYSDPTLDPGTKRRVKPGVTIAGPIIKVQDTNEVDIIDVRSTPSLLPDGSIEFKLPVQVLPNITHTDSDGSPVELPAQTPFVASPALPEVIVPQPLKITNPATLPGAYTSEHPGDLIDLFSTGIFASPDYSMVCPRYRKCDPTNHYRLDPTTPNPNGGLHRYTLLNFTPADVNETTWSSGVQIPGKENFVVDWLFEWGFDQGNKGIFSPVSLALDEVGILNAALHKGWGDWIASPLEFIMKSMCPDLSADQAANGHNFLKKGIYSGSNEIWMWTPNYDWDSPTSVFTRSVSGDHSRRPVANSITALYICRKVLQADWAPYLT